MPVGTAFHERTLALCESLSYREWSGYYTVSVYETTHEHEYNAIRNSAALIDISPLFKYRVTGRDATKFVNRVIARDINKVSIDQVIYCCWCDPEGKVIDDGTITRLCENEYRWTSADPSLRWFQQNALALDVKIEDISERIAALALQGPMSGRVLRAVADAAIDNLKYCRGRCPPDAGKSRAFPWTFPAPVIPATWALRFGCRGSTPSKSGTRSSAKARPLTSIPPACSRWTSRVSKQG